MIVDCDKYKLNKEFIQKWYLEKGRNEPSRAISTMACSSGVPCIVVAYWIGEVSGWPQEVINSIHSLVKFYGYTGVINKPEGSPV